MWLAHHVHWYFQPIADYKYIIAMLLYISIVLAIFSSPLLEQSSFHAHGDSVRCNWPVQFSWLCTYPNNYIRGSTELRFLPFDQAEPLLLVLFCSSPAMPKHQFAIKCLDTPNEKLSGR